MDDIMNDVNCFDVKILGGELFGAMVMAFTVDVKAALVFAVTIPALSVVVFGVMLSTIPLYKKVQSRLDGVLSKTRENLTGTRVIRAFCLEGEEAEEFDRRTVGRYDASCEKAGKYSGDKKRSQNSHLQKSRISCILYHISADIAIL